MMKKLKPWIGLVVFCVLFFGSGESGIGIPNFVDLTGSFGRMHTLDGYKGIFSLDGAEGAKAGFIFAVSIVPAVMLGCGVLRLMEYLGTSRLLEEILRVPIAFMTGLPKESSMPLVMSMHSSDIGAYKTLELKQAGAMTSAQAEAAAMWQFSGSGIFINMFTNGLPLIPYLTVNLAWIILLVLFVKTLGANIYRMYSYVGARTA